MSKYIITKKILYEWIFSYTENSPKYYILATVISFSLLIYYPIQDLYGAFYIGKYYYGKIVPNIWHNPTTMFVFPFALLLFKEQLKIFSLKEKAEYGELVYVLFLIIINILIKPSFFIVYAPVTLLFLLLYNRRNQNLYMNLIILLIGMSLLFLMYKLIYVLELGIYNNSTGRIVLAAPFESWTYFVPGWYIPISFVHSLALPIFYFTAFRKLSLQNTATKYALFLFITGMLISFFLIEEGSRKYHGNFMWQNAICYYILLLTIVADLLRKYFNEGLKGFKMKAAFALFVLHVLSGLVYIIKMFVTGSPA